jgi:hypothetical protein
MNHECLPPPTSLPYGLQCTIGMTFLPLHSTTSIPSLFLTVSDVQRLAHRSTCLKRPPEKTTWLCSLLDTSIADATHARD